MLTHDFEEAIVGGTVMTKTFPGVQKTETAEEREEKIKKAMSDLLGFLNEGKGARDIVSLNGDQVRINLRRKSKAVLHEQCVYGEAVKRLICSGQIDIKLCSKNILWEFKICTIKE